MSLIVPLPEAVRRLVSQNTHPGLMLDKYVASWDPTADSGKLSERVQKPAVQKVVELSNSPPPGIDYSALLGRWQEVTKARGAVRFQAETVGPLTLHLARASALENAGICLHPIYGFAYLPGTGLKGMARAYAETLWLPAQLGPDWPSASDDQWNAALDKLEGVFGYVPSIEPAPPTWQQMSELARALDRRRKQRNKLLPPAARSHCGQIVFFDAWPTTWPRLIVDILNNHHPSYYRDAEPPGDWDNPVPVYFLAVPAGQQFSFALAKRRCDVPGDLLDLAQQWLAGALGDQGAGAKTATGYGAFKLPEGAPGAPQAAAAHKDRQSATALSAGGWPGSPHRLRAEFSCTLELVAPAFLAGANQQEGDCELRPATLRGLLRWWWRTMHAGFVEVKTLRALEAAIWGDTAQGGAVRITVKPISGTTPLPYDKEQVASQNALPLPPNPKTTRGLWYFSFGMDDTRRQGGQRMRFQRRYVAPGAKWQVGFSARGSAYELRNSKGEVTHRQPLSDPQLLLRQALAALWLLCHYGGVGSKARKGFGSLGVPNELASWSLKKCKEEAEQFRQACAIAPDPSEKRAASPSLRQMLELSDIATGWTNPWFALDRLGAVAQEFAQSHKHNPEKQALGLPRRIGPPAKGFFPIGDRVRKTGRHASPVLYHLAQNANGLVLRAVAFPSPELPADPSAQKSRQFLQQLLDYLKRRLTEVTQQTTEPGQGRGPTNFSAPSQSGAGGGLRPTVSPTAPPLKAGQQVEVTVVPDPKGRGRVFGRHEPSGRVGPVLDANQLSPPPKEGDKLTVLVASISSSGKDIQFKAVIPRAK